MIDVTKLQEGDIIRNKGSGQAYTVINRDGKFAVAVRSVSVMNPDEWDLVLRPTKGLVDTARFTELEESEPAKPKKPPAMQVNTQSGRFQADAPNLANAPREQSAPKPDPNPWIRYEFRGGGSNKFWEIKLDGTKYTTRWGRIGTDGSVTVKEFGSNWSAKHACQKIIDEKEAKGYRLVSR